MSSLLLEQLENSGLLKGQIPDVAALERLSKTAILDLLHESAELTSAAQFSRDHSIFSQSATLSLGGGRQPCISLDCRLRHGRNLGQYAALYADRIYVHNFLTDHIQGHENVDEEELKADVYNDLVLLGYFRPLIEAGRIIPITPPDEFCPTCFTSHLAGKDVVHRRNALHRWLSAKYLNETEVELEKMGDTYGYLVSGSDQLLEHGYHVSIRKRLPNNLRRLPRLMQRIRDGETVTLSKSVRRRVAKIHEDYAELILQNVFFEMACSQCLGTAFLTERPLHIETLNKLSHNRELTERNHLVQEHLTALVPFVSSLRMKDLIALREQEGDAFLAFRQALTQAVDDYRKSQNQRFNARDASQLYGDVVEPGLAKLDQAVSAAKKNLLKGSAAKVVAWAGAISFGLYAGFLPKELAQAAAALGLTKILAELGSPLVNSAFARDNLATSDMYFLWRVRDVARKKGGY